MVQYSVDRQIARTLAGLGLVLSLITPVSAAPDGGDVLKGLAACQAMGEPQTRLGCFDELARRSLRQAAAQPAPAISASTDARAARAPTAPVTTAQTQTVPDHSGADAAETPANGYTLPDKFEKLTFTITKVDTSRPGKLRLITADGPVLEQTHPIKNFKKTPVPGDPVMVFHQMLGFGCRTNKSDYFRCRPIEN